MALNRGSIYDDRFGRYYSYPVLSSSTFLAGDLVYFDSNGRLEQLVAAGSAYTTQLIAGMAAEPAVSPDRGTVASNIQILIWDTSILLSLPLYSATATNAVWNSNLVGNEYGIINTASGFPAVNFDDTTNTKVRIVNVEYDDGNGAPNYVTGNTTPQYPKVIVVPLANPVSIGNGAFLSGARP